MMRKYLVGIAVLGMLWPSQVWAAPPSSSWEGLVGLFTQPTAETVRGGEATITFSELRFRQEDINRTTDTWFTGSAMYKFGSRWEFAVTSRHEIIRVGPASASTFTEEFDESYFLGHIKYIIEEPGKRKVGLAAGVMDITNATEEVDGFSTDRGRRFFLVGTMDWASLGLSHDNDGLGIFAGARWEATDNIDLVAEWVSRPVFTQTTPAPSNKVNFNLGARIYPRQSPNLHVDVSAIGDGEFDFGFSLSYLFNP